MKTRTTAFDGLLVIEPDVFHDDRGYFFEAYTDQKFEEILSGIEFVQDNISSSKLGTVRGLHYQVGTFAQGKLCQVISGRVFDVAVDIRFGSPTFGKYFSIELSEENHLQLWIPPGFAHGFTVRSSEAIFLYKCTTRYSKADERTIRYSDPALAIDWNVVNPMISPKDEKGKLLSEIERDFIYSA